MGRRRDQAKARRKKQREGRKGRIEQQREAEAKKLVLRVGAQ